jgi:hypothetical protein
MNKFKYYIVYLDSGKTYGTQSDGIARQAKNKGSLTHTVINTESDCVLIDENAQEIKDITQYNHPY